MKQALSIKGLRKVYDGGKVALKGIDFSVVEGGFFGLLGPNGAGKSTLIGISCGLLTKTEGEVIIQGHNKDTILILMEILQKFMLALFRKNLTSVFLKRWRVFCSLKLGIMEYLEKKSPHK